MANNTALAVAAPTNQHFQEVWDHVAKRASSRWQEITGKKLDTTGLQSTDDLLKTIEHKSGELKEFRKRKHRLFGTLKAAMMPIELFGNIASGGASVVFPPSSVIFGAVSYLIGAAENVSAAYDAIEGMLDTIKDCTTRLEIHTRHVLSRVLKDKLSDVLCVIVEVLALSWKVVAAGRLKAYFKDVFMAENKKIQDAVDRLSKAVEGESRLTLVEASSRIHDIGDGVQDVADRVGTGFNTVISNVKQVNETLKDVHSGQNELHKEFGSLATSVNKVLEETKVQRGHNDLVKLKLILEPTEAAQDIYDDISKRREPETGDWIQNEALFSSWMEGKFPVLWIPGYPGFGKSFLSSRIIEILRMQSSQSPGSQPPTTVSYYFFKDNSPDTRSFRRALVDMAFEIAKTNAHFLEHALNECHSAEDIKTIPTIWRKLFKTFFVNHSRGYGAITYMVIDGLDEALENDVETFLPLLRDLHSACGELSSCQLKIVIVGRPHMIKQIEFSDVDLPSIPINAQKNTRDIKKYISGSVQRLIDRRILPETLRSEILSSLEKGANGMFLWVDLVLKEVMKQKTEGAKRKVLQRAPQGINAMIRHVLENFSATLQGVEGGAENLNELLAWVTFAKRPMTLGELDVILARQSSPEEGMVDLEGELRTEYASLFTLTREDGRTTEDLQLHRKELEAFVAAREIEGDAHEEEFQDLLDCRHQISDPLTTRVSFCHAAIGDFFRNGHCCRISLGPDYPQIGFDPPIAKTRPLEFCLKFLCNPDPLLRLDPPLQHADCRMVCPKIAQAINLAIYVVGNWEDHLQIEVNLDEGGLDLDPSYRTRIASLLTVLFQNEASIKSWWFLCELFHDLHGKDTMDFSWLILHPQRSPLSLWEVRLPPYSLIDDWLEGSERYAVPKHDDICVSECRTDKTHILSTMITVCSKMWLREESVEQKSTNRLFGLAYAYVHMNEGIDLSLSPLSRVDLRVFKNGINGKLETEEIELNAGRKVLAKEILATARKFCFCEDVIWHARIASTWIRHKDWQDTLLLVNQACEIDGSCLSSMQVLAKFEICNGDIEAAQSICQRMESISFPSSPGTTSTMLRDLWLDIGDAFGEQHEEKALASYYMAFSMARHRSDCIFKIIRLSIQLSAVSRIDELTSGLEHIVPAMAHPISYSTCHVLTDIMGMLRPNERFLLHDWENDWFDAFTADSPFMVYYVEKLVSAIAYAKKARLSSEIVINLQLYWVTTMLNWSQIDRPKAIRILQAILAIEGKPASGLVQKHSKNAVSTLIKTHTEAALEMSDYARSVFHVEEADRLMNLYVCDEHSTIFTTRAMLILGLAYIGEIDRAREWFTTIVKDASWTQSEYTNPSSLHFKGCAKGFMALEHDSQAIAICHHLKWHVGRLCDGCNHQFSNVDFMFTCRYCYDVDFCETCLELRKSDTLIVQRCSSKHRWITIPPQTREVQDDEICLDGVVMKYAVFVNDIRKQWGLDEIPESVFLKAYLRRRRGR